jgi:hypothetical protein
MKILNVIQGEEDWLESRMGIPTASEIDALVTPLWKPRTGEGVETYIDTKLAELWLGHPLQSFNGGAMEQGKIKEDEAIPWHEFTYGRSIQRVGFVTDDEGTCGCSPDGMFEDWTGIEIKCPQAHTHVGYLRKPGLPKAYAAQVQFSMFVTGSRQWEFLSYCRGFPAMRLTVPRNDEAMQVFAEVVPAFNERMARGWNQLCELNGGPPERPRLVSAGGGQ